MSLEQIQEKERALREKSEEERKIEYAEAMRIRLEREKLFEIFEKDKKLAFLRSMIDRWLLEPSDAENIVKGEVLELDDLQEILDKIDGIEAVSNIEKILPKEHRLSKEEYIAALSDDALRLKLLYKIDGALTYIHDTLYPSTFSVMDFLGNFFSTMTKGLVIAQENMIDIKHSLQK